MYVATFTHKCGHASKLAYANRHFADQDRASMEAQICGECLNRAKMAEWRAKFPNYDPKFGLTT